MHVYWSLSSNKHTVKPAMNEAFVGLALMDLARLYEGDKT